MNNGEPLHLPIRPASREEALRDDPLREFFVWWDDPTGNVINEFSDLLDSAEDERPLQRFLEVHPEVLIRKLHGGHGRWCVPHKRLGSELIPDFVIGERSSMGFEWYAVELESPAASMFNQANEPSRTLNHALTQISDWRIWLKKNIDYATRSRNQQGLGLTDIDGDLPGIVLIGRRDKVKADTNARRRQACKERNVIIHTYDWLLGDQDGLPTATLGLRFRDA